jgi:hypothetical protein
MEKQLTVCPARVGSPTDFDDIIAHTPSADGVTYEAATIAGISGWW